MAPPKKMICMPILEEGVYRFDASEAARQSASPSISFAAPRTREVELQGATKAPQRDCIPHCRDEHGQQTITLKLQEGASFYGTGEIGGGLDRSGRRVICWNTDAWGYSRTTSSLYQSHPWVLAVLPDGASLGILADTTRRCEVDLRKDGVIKFSASGHFPVITFGPYSTPAEAIAALSRAIGTMEIPPRWALGFHQCRFSYETTDRVLEIAAEFRGRRIPCDVIWMDIDYMHGFRCFTFDPATFPDPKGLADELHQQGFKAVWMIDPGIKKEAGYSVYDSGTKEDVWVQKASGGPFVGDVWPGSCVFPDYTMARARSWWSALIRDFTANGVDGIWNDMNEPSVFYVMSKTMPENNVHRGDEQLGGKQSHAFYHNVYGMLMARATWEGIRQAQPEKRPFVLTRAAYIGSHRYAATWTGDNLATWEHLHMSIPMALNLGLSGQPFAGPDIGGFAGDATPKLFARWMGIGALLPFSRAHSETGTRDHEPWSFGEECENICRLALERRYRLLPHFYTLFYKCHMSGIPVMTPLIFEDPKDPKLRKVDDSFMLGPLLVSCCTGKADTPNPDTVVLPRGTWRRFHFDDVHPDLPLLYLKGGSILPTGPVLQSVEHAMPEDPVTLFVALDDNGRAQGELFEDAGDGYGYQKGESLHTYYGAETNEAGNEVVVEVTRSEGTRTRPRRALVVRVLLGEAAVVEGKGMDGDAVRVALPAEADAAKLVAKAKKQDLVATEDADGPMDERDGPESLKGVGASMTPVEIGGGEWSLKVVPWVGGRIVSMVHIPSGREWLESRTDVGGYEEYSGTEYRSPGCTEAYDVIGRELVQSDEEDAIVMEGDIGGGLVFRREVMVPKGARNSVRVASSIVARSVGAGSGGFSRIVCLRTHPSFKLPASTDAAVCFTALDGSRKELLPEFGEAVLKGQDRPNGEWMLVDREEGWAMVNKFDVEEVDTCFVHWGGGFCNLELYSPERPVSAANSLSLTHEFEVRRVKGEN